MKKITLTVLLVAVTLRAASKEDAAELAKSAAENASLRAQLIAAEKQRDVLAASLNNLGSITKAAAAHAASGRADVVDTMARNAEAARVAAQTAVDASAQTNNSMSVTISKMDKQVLLTDIWHMVVGLLTAIAAVFAYLAKRGTSNLKIEIDGRLSQLLEAKDQLLETSTAAAHARGVLDEKNRG